MTIKKESIFAYNKKGNTNSFGAFLSRIMLYMSGGVAISAFASFLFLNTSLIKLLFIINSYGQIVGITPLAQFAPWMPLITYFIYTYAIDNGDVKLEMAFFATYSFLMGMSLSYIFLIYTGESILYTFLITIVSFLAMSLYAQTTSTNLLQYGGLVRMFLIGFIVSSLANAFIFQSIGFDFLLSIGVVVLFLFIVAYDIQKIRQAYITGYQSEYYKIKLAFGLYLAFIILFSHLLRIIGSRRNN